MNAAIILAAGASSRLGQPKQLVEVDGESLVARTTRLTVRAGLTPFVVVGANRGEIESVLGDVEIVPNDRWQAGMQTSIAAGVKSAAQRGATTVTIVPCDLPRLQSDHLQRLVDALAEVPIAAATYDDVTGAPAAFSRELFEELQRLPEAEGARSLIRSGRWDVARIPIPEAAIDLDTPDDLEALR